MIIHHVKQTPIAWAPDELSAAINKYTSHTSSVSNTVLEGADLIHFHNLFLETNIRSLIQYHSEPEKVNLNFKGPKSTLAQYHATLCEYRGFKVLRNVIDFAKPEYNIELSNKGGPLIVGFTPSTNHATKYGTKGILETLQVLEKLRFKYLNRFEYRLLQGFPIKESLMIRKSCHILIDECATDSYHRTGLEALALGKVAICSLSKDVEDVLLKSSGAKYSPFENVQLQNLETYLEQQLEIDISKIIEKGLANRGWMEKFWKPEDVVGDYINYYKDVLNGIC